MEPPTLEQVSDRVLTMQAMTCRKIFAMHCEIHGKFKVELSKAMQRQSENPNDSENIANEAIKGEGMVDDVSIFHSI